MQTIFRLCVFAFLVLVEPVLSIPPSEVVEDSSTFEYRLHTPIGMFKLGKQIGEGSFGKVKRGVYLKTQMEVAIKIETDDRENDKHRSNLAIEKSCYDDLGVQPGIPQIVYYGDHEDGEEKIMVMEMLGLHLDKMFIDAKFNFSIERIHWIAKQLIDRIECVHRSGWVYIDIKPENFAVGKHDTWLIYIFDFGLSQRYLDENGEHIKQEPPVRYGPGTLEFMSITAHKNQILSRRDDIEGIGYLILYFLQGTLPWTDEVDKGDYETQSNNIHKRKLKFEYESLGGHAERMKTFFEYAWSLKFESEPDYKHLRKLLDEILS